MILTFYHYQLKGDDLVVGKEERLAGPKQVKAYQDLIVQLDYNRRRWEKAMTELSQLAQEPQLGGAQSKRPTFQQADPLAIR